MLRNRHDPELQARRAEIREGIRRRFMFPARSPGRRRTYSCGLCGAENAGHNWRGCPTRSPGCATCKGRGHLEVPAATEAWDVILRADKRTIFARWCPECAGRRIFHAE